MFTGIIEETGRIEGIRDTGGGRQIEVSARTVLEGTRVGDSVAVNGTCLTVTATVAGGLQFDAVAETLSRTTLGSLKVGDPVNLERPLAVGDRLGGHFVQGHVDGVARVVAIEADGTSQRWTFELPEDLQCFVVEKGSIAIDGVSLTVAGLDGSRVSVALIPHTLDHTAFRSLRIGDVANVEVDMLGKYVARLLGPAV